MYIIKQVLLVEDDIDDQCLFSDALNRIHPALKHTIANDGVEALSILENFPEVDLVFMDINMPKMDGFECLTCIKNSDKFKHIPVVILSTSDHPEHIKRCKELGAAYYFSKPSDFKELFATISHIILKVSNDN